MARFSLFHMFSPGSRERFPWVFSCVSLAIASLACVGVVLSRALERRRRAPRRGPATTVARSLTFLVSARGRSMRVWPRACESGE